MLKSYQNNIVDAVIIFMNNGVTDVFLLSLLLLLLLSKIFFLVSIQLLFSCLDSSSYIAIVTN